MRIIGRSLRGRLTKIENLKKIGEFDRMSIDELQDFCDREVLSCLAMFDGDTGSLIASIQSQKDWLARNSVASNYQQHLSDMRRRGFRV